MNPTHVEVNEASLQILRVLYKNAYRQIYSEINGATNFGVANRKQIIGQIDKVLIDLGVDVNAFVKKEITGYYKTGAIQAVQQLSDMGADIPVKTGFNRIHQTQINNLVSDTATSFADSIQGVKRSTTQLLSQKLKQEIRQQIATGLIQGQAVKKAAQQIKGVLAQEGLKALVDKGGKTWQLDTYGEMLYRTKSVEARNLGLANRMLENGYDLVQVSIHHSTHEACLIWEGKILSMTGNTPDYPTLDDAEEAGLFHPNCEHAINAIVPDLATKLNAYNSYTGEYQKGGAIEEMTIPTP